MNSDEVTEKILSDMEDEISNIYTKAYNKLSKKWYKFMSDIEPEGNAILEKFDEAKKLKDKQAMIDAKSEFNKYMRTKTFMNKRFRDMMVTTAKKITRVNEVATDYINGKTPKIYTINYNDIPNVVEKMGIKFDIVDEYTVKNLMLDPEQRLLPIKEIDIPKDIAWNIRNMNAELLQGILQGESIPKIADRLKNVTDMNKKASIRNARTMTTCAENKGRLDQYYGLKNKGCIIQKQWSSAHGKRTREWHMELNGQKKEIDQPFENAVGKIMYPGDPDAKPANTYNCRCALIADVIGFIDKNGVKTYI